MLWGIEPDEDKIMGKSHLSRPQADRARINPSTVLTIRNIACNASVTATLQKPRKTRAYEPNQHTESAFA